MSSRSYSLLVLYSSIFSEVPSLVVFTGFAFLPLGVSLWWKVSHKRDVLPPLVGPQLLSHSPMLLTTPPTLLNYIFPQPNSMGVVYKEGTLNHLSPFPPLNKTLFKLSFNYILPPFQSYECCILGKNTHLSPTPLYPPPKLLFNRTFLFRLIIWIARD